MLDKFDSGYNDAMHSNMVMTSPLVNSKDVAHVAKDGTESENQAVNAPAIYSVGQRASISKKNCFVKGFEKWAHQFRISKPLGKSPRPVYEFEHPRGE